MVLLAEIDRSGPAIEAVAHNIARSRKSAYCFMAHTCIDLVRRHRWWLMPLAIRGEVMRHHTQFFGPEDRAFEKVWVLAATDNVGSAGGRHPKKAVP
jgi:alkylhydroperoxidase family enzyme